jgi:hypothetical protein
VELAARARVAALNEVLYELEVSSTALRRDPRGRTWLDPVWRAEIERTPALRAALDEFIEEELELFDSVRVRADFVFTSEVVTATESDSMFGVGLDPRHRTWVIATAYSLALGVAYLLWMQLVRDGPW